MSIKPLHDYVLIKGMKKEEVTKSGIVLPGASDKERPESGEVIAVGPGKTYENGQKQAMSVAVGQKVIFKKYSPDEIEVDDNEYLVIRESDIVAIIE